jgi:hypothetical protein
MIASGAEGAMASGYEMRVGDAEREATAAELREHYASGRLTLDELNERIDKAFAAKTRGDLNALMTDLPSARPGSAGAAGLAGATPGSGPFGTGGPFGPSGPFGPGGALGPGQVSASGPGADWGQGSGWDQGSGAGAGYRASRCGPARTAGSIFTTLLVMGALLTVGVFGVFGVFGTGRPFGIVLILAAFALLRRLFFRRRVIRGRGPRGRRRW